MIQTVTGVSQLTEQDLQHFINIFSAVGFIAISFFILAWLCHHFNCNK